MIILFLSFCHCTRTRGVPSHLLGSGHFDDNSSDNSTDEKNQDAKQQYDIENGDECSNRGKSSVESNAGMNNNTDRYDYQDDNHCDADNDTNVRSINTNESLSLSKQKVGASFLGFVVC